MPVPSRLIQRDSIWFLLTVYFGAWVISHLISDGNLDPAGNMLENFAWGQYFTWGTAKHPPLMAWVAATWFSVFPTADGFYHALAYLASGVGLLGTFHVARSLGYPRLAMPATLLLSLALPYSTLAVKFNANTILLSVWPWLVWSWLYALRGRNINGALLLGLLAALAMLAKYYSGVLILTLGAATLITESGRRWLLSRYFVVSVAMGIILVVPHINWLFENNFPTLRYVEGKGDGEADFDGWIRFALAPFSYWIIPWFFVAWFTSRGESVPLRVRQWFFNLIRAWKPSKDHQVLFALAFLPWTITLLIGATGFVNLRSHWAIPIGFAFPLLWLSNLVDEDEPRLARVYENTRRVFFGWLALIVVLAPVYAWQQAISGTANFYRPRADTAHALLAEWQKRAPDQSLSWVGGEWAESISLAFYGDNRIRAVHGFPGEFPAVLIGHEHWQQEAGLILCPLGQVEKPVVSDCPEHAASWFQNNGQVPVEFEITIAREGFRFPRSRPFQYRVFLYLPDREGEG